MALNGIKFHCLQVVNGGGRWCKLWIFKSLSHCTGLNGWGDRLVSLVCWCVAGGGFKLGHKDSI